MERTSLLPTLYEDNTKAINLSKEPGSEHRGARHIDVRYHWISECMKLGKIGEIRWISGKENLADVFTKNVGRPEFERWRDVLVSEIEKEKMGEERDVRVEGVVLDYNPKYGMINHCN